jgi:hypothetical protein
MTLFLDFRTQDVGGSVAGPFLYEGTADPYTVRAISPAEARVRSAGKNLLVAAHGFNVSRPSGARSLAQIEPALALGPSDLFIAVLWPGDYWLPVVNYPFEGSVAIDCGQRLANACDDWFAAATSLTFASHSLGGRLILEAVANLGRPAQALCLTAAAVNQDCLTAEYAGAAKNALRIAILASHEDMVLKIAFRIGDPISDLLHDDHSYFEKALGYDGPPVPAPLPVLAPWQISDRENYGHGSYLPKGDAMRPPDPTAQWWKVATFMAQTFRGRPQNWP